MSRLPPERQRHMHVSTYIREETMSVERAVLAFAGVMVLLSVVLTVYVSPLFVWFTVFIGANMLQSAFTGFCPAAMAFKALGYKPGSAF
jgi:Flp pilus assembly protein TadB